MTPDMTAETRWLRSPYVGAVSLRVRMQMSYKASLSMQKVSSEFSTSCYASIGLEQEYTWTESVAL